MYAAYMGAGGYPSVRAPSMQQVLAVLHQIQMVGLLVSENICKDQFLAC